MFLFKFVSIISKVIPKYKIEEKSKYIFFSGFRYIFCPQCFHHLVYYCTGSNKSPSTRIIGETREIRPGQETGKGNWGIVGGFLAGGLDWLIDENVWELFQMFWQTDWDYDLYRIKEMVHCFKESFTPFK